MMAVLYDRYGGPEKLRLSNLDPQRPARDEVRVRLINGAGGGSGTMAMQLAKAVGGVYRAVGGSVRVLRPLVLAGRLLSKARSIGVLAVPPGRALTERVARLALDGRLTPHLDAVLPLSSVPDALAHRSRRRVREDRHQALATIDGSTNVLS